MNSLILSNLQKLSKQARTRGETYRAKAFDHAVDTISKLGTEITDVKQLKHIKGIGKGITDRVDEILKTKKLAEVETVSDKDSVIDTFLNILGVGIATVERWYNKGHRTLDDIRKYEKLNHAQDVTLLGNIVKTNLNLKILSLKNAT
jgi:DNA polymerase lambda